MKAASLSEVITLESSKITVTKRGQKFSEDDTHRKWCEPPNVFMAKVSLLLSTITCKTH